MWTRPTLRIWVTASRALQDSEGTEGGGDLQEGLGECLEKVRGPSPGDQWSVGFLGSPAWPGQLLPCLGPEDQRVVGRTAQGAARFRECDLRLFSGFSAMLLDLGVAVGSPRLYWKTGPSEAQGLGWPLRHPALTPELPALCPAEEPTWGVQRDPQGSLLQSVRVVGVPWGSTSREPAFGAQVMSWDSCWGAAGGAAGWDSAHPGLHSIAELARRV